MGIIEKDLADFTLGDGSKYKIEYNMGNIIHIHVDTMRIDCSVNEFREMARVVGEGAEWLRSNKDLEQGGAH